VRATFRAAAMMAAAVMVGLALLCQLVPDRLIRTFSDDPQVVAVGVEYLRIVSWTFVGSGVIFVASSMFQAMGNTLPALITSLARVLLVAIPLVLLARLPGFELRWVWYLSAVAVVFQFALNMLLLQREFRIRMRFEPTAAV